MNRTSPDRLAGCGCAALATPGACPAARRHRGPAAALKLTAAVLMVGALAAGLSACAPLLIGGAAVGGAFSYTDRRTSGTQIDDKAIELKAGSRVGAAIGDRGHVNVTAYNRMALITGEVPTEADRVAVEKAIAGIDNVASTDNELAVMGSSALTARANDAVLTSKVKASFLDHGDLQSNAFKVVTERGIVYLMGRVTQAEADLASTVARNVSGVQKVVLVFDIITEAELKALPGQEQPTAK
jgi:osmotically-inducible protein OsmY